MTPFEIKVALMKEGVSMRSIARRIGVSANSVSLVVNKRMSSRRIMEAIAKSIKTREATAFPEYFNRPQGP